MGREIVAKSPPHPLQSADQGEGIGQPQTKPIHSANKAEGALQRTAGAADGKNLSKLEKQRKHERSMDEMCDKVLAQIPASSTQRSSKALNEFYSVSQYLDKTPYIQIDGHSSPDTLREDASRCRTHMMDKFYEEEARAFEYNNSKEGKAELQRQIDADNARIRAQLAKRKNQQSI